MKSLQNRTKAMETPCIWMQAGVAKKKNCTHYYDCTSCKFDAGMKKMAAAGKHLSWQEALRRFDAKDRTCRHALTRRTGHRTCPMNYNCDRCDFDQTFEDSMVPATAAAVTRITDIKGFTLPQDRYFHSGHTWAKIEDGGFIRVGMDDFSFKVLGNPDRLALPLMGQELNRGRAGWGMNRNENMADVLSPVNGIITRVNPRAMKGRSPMGEDPYEENWLFTVHNSNLKAAVKPLMDDETSPAWLDAEITGLEEMIESVTGPMATDGGTLRSDVYGSLPTLGWQRLVSRFLGT